MTVARRLTWGAAVGVAVVAPAVLPVVEAMLLLAVLVVVPAAVPLHPARGRVGDGRRPPAGHARWPVALIAGALPTAPALLLPRGPLAALLSVPWVLVTTAWGSTAARRWMTAPPRAPHLGGLAAAAYLVVGSAWLLFDRADLEPAGIGAPFVLLTAVHFHYAGFTAATLSAAAVRHLPGRRSAVTAMALTVAAPPLVALGFTLAPPMQAVGAALLAAGLWLLAWVTVRHVSRGAPPGARVALVVSSISVVVPMALAVHWAVATNVGAPALSIAQMARTHGVVNAVGFALPGVLGWRLLERRRAAGVPGLAANPTPGGSNCTP